MDINKIDTGNYYNVLKSGNRKYITSKTLSVHFLLEHEVTPIILNEFEALKLNIPQTNVLCKLADGQFIILNVYDKSQDIGFVYCGVFGTVDKLSRSVKSPYIETHNAEYVQSIIEQGGEKSEAIVVKKLPANIYLVWCERYWFQFTDNETDNKYLFSKPMAEKILRQDLRAFLKTQLK